MRWRRVLAHAVVVLAGLACSIATLAIPQRIEAASAKAYYGEPFWFAVSDMSHYGSLRRDQAWRFNPWESPTDVDGYRFLGSVVMFGTPFAGVAWLLSRRRKLEM
jgi:hypothetical protein